MENQNSEMIEETSQKIEDQPVKSMWQQTKESWYDKIPLTLKQLDIIVYTCWALLGLAVIAVALDAMGVF